MKLSRELRRLVCRILAGVLLFAQLAVAAHACPGVSAPAQASARSMPGCHQMDPDAAALCAEHCRLGQQSADTASPPTVQAAIPVMLYLLPGEPLPALASAGVPAAPDAAMPAAPPPPHTVLHCVLRI
jgi:hypothetical protein